MYIGKKDRESRGKEETHEQGIAVSPRSTLIFSGGRRRLKKGADIPFCPQG